MPADVPEDGACFLLVEDNPLEARAVARVLRRYGRVVTARTIAEAAERSRRRDLTAAVVDWKLPDGDGLAFVRSLRTTYPRLPVLLLTVHLDRDCINRTHLLGAEYVSKPPTRENLTSFAQRALEPAEPIDDLEALARRWASVYALSPSETEILRLAMLGVDRADFGDRMGISDNTVKTYVKRLLTKSRADSVDALVRRILAHAVKA